MSGEEKSLSLSEEKQNSITLKKDAKGNYNWEIKVYFSEDDAAAIKKIEGIDKQLKESFTKDV